MNKILSLFSGAGGIDIGFKSNSFETYAAVDNWNIACDTLKKNKISKNVICSDIKDVNFSKFKGKVDIVVGGPPCPPYSKSRFYIKEKKRALEEIDRQYAKCRSQKTINQEQREDLIVKCINERINN